MRTQDPVGIRVDFVAALADIRRTFINVNATNLVAAEKNLIAEYALLSAATLLEGFVSDLFVAYINRDNSVFRAALVAQMTIGANDELAKRAKSHAIVTLPKHLSTLEIRSILDSRNYNVTFANIPDLKAKAGQWLPRTTEVHFTSLDGAQSATLEAVRAVRNFLAHRSGASRTSMQDALAHHDLALQLRRGVNKIRDVGSFLRSQPATGQPVRLLLYLETLDRIALHLCP